MRDKSGDETELPPPTPPTYIPCVVFLWLCLLSDTTSGAAVRCDSQWDDASFKPAVGGFHDYSCGLERGSSSFRFLSVSRISRLSCEYNKSCASEREREREREREKREIEIFDLE